jgi:hypothetical protein
MDAEDTVSIAPRSRRYTDPHIFDKKIYILLCWLWRHTTANYVCRNSYFSMYRWLSPSEQKYMSGYISVSQIVARLIILKNYRDGGITVSIFLSLRQMTIHKDLILRRFNRLYVVSRWDDLTDFRKKNSIDELTASIYTLLEMMRWWVCPYKNM